MFFWDLSFITLPHHFWAHGILTGASPAHSTLQPVCKRGWAPIPGGDRITSFPGHCLACTVAVPLSLHRNIFIISFPSTFPCFPDDEMLDNTTKAPEKLFWHSYSCQDFSLHCHFSIYLGISQLKHGECVWAHLHGLSPAAGGEVFCWHSASSLCWNGNKSWNSKKGQHHRFT